MIAKHVGWSLLLSFCLCATGLAAATVRVAVVKVVPRIQVNGTPVRARMFWGAPGSRPLRISPAGKVVTFEFSATEDEPKNATMHFRFGQLAGDSWLDDIQVDEVESSRDVLPRCDFSGGLDSFEDNWTVWPVDAKNTVGTVAVTGGSGQRGLAALHVHLKDPPGGSWPDFHIDHKPNLSLRKGRHYRVSFWARAVPERDLTIAFYRPGRVYTYLGGPPGCFASQIKLAASADDRASPE